MLLSHHESASEEGLHVAVTVRQVRQETSPVSVLRGPVRAEPLWHWDATPLSLTPPSQSVA